MAGGTRALLVGGVAAGLILGACGGGQPEPEEGPTVRTVSAECREAFAEVPTGSPELGDVAPTDPASPLPTEFAGALGDLYGTVPACSTVEEWTEAFRGQRLPITRNADPVATLRSLCQSTDDEQVRSDPLCEEVGVPDETGADQDEGAELDASPSPTG